MKQKQSQDIENRLVVVTGEGDREGRIGNLGLSRYKLIHTHTHTHTYIHTYIHTYRIDK